MPIPSSINDLDTNPNNNSPQGSETVGPNANGYIQALSAFIKQIATGAGWKPTATVDMNAQKITNIAQGTISTTSKDAVRGDQLYKIGEVRMWHGNPANITSVWGAGWQLCDGTNGTANLSDKFVLAYGPSHAVEATGGASTMTLSTAQLPSHNHGVNDGGHSHGVTDHGHTHGYTDPGHLHANHVGNVAAGSPATGAAMSLQNPGGNDFNSDPSLTGISITPNLTGVTVNLATTGITTQNTGSGASIDKMPPFYTLAFIEYVGP